MVNPRRFLALAFAGLLLFGLTQVGCGGSDDNKDTTTTSDTTTSDATSDMVTPVDTTVDDTTAMDTTVPQDVKGDTGPQCTPPDPTKITNGCTANGNPTDPFILGGVELTGPTTPKTCTSTADCAFGDCVDDDNDSNTDKICVLAKDATAAAAECAGSIPSTVLFSGDRPKIQAAAYCCIEPKNFATQANKNLKLSSNCASCVADSAACTLVAGCAMCAVPGGSKTEACKKCRCGQDPNNNTKNVNCVAEFATCSGTPPSNCDFTPPDASNGDATSDASTDDAADTSGTD